MIRYILIVLFVFALYSCATKTKIEYRDRVLTEYNTKEVHDTLFIHTSDSVHHNMFQRNDTVFDIKYIERTKWRERIVEKHDTCWRDKRVTEYMEKTKEVKYIPNIYKYAFAFSILVIIFAFARLYKLFRN